MYKARKAFTLIELLIVIAIIAILATVVFVALNPPKRFADARNARRTADVQSILTAIHQYIVDNGGTIPPGVGSGNQLGTCATGGATNCAGAANACLNMSTTLAQYLRSIPVDPQGTAAETGYYVESDANNMILVRACLAEQQAIIEAAR